MRIGVRSVLGTALLAVAISFVAKDLALPLFIISLFGLSDRLFGSLALRAGRQ